MGRQGDLLERLEPRPALTPAMRTAVLPQLAALLLEAMPGPAQNRQDGTAASTGAGDEQDRI